MPESPAMIRIIPLKRHFSILPLFITAVSGINGYQLIGVILIIINLRGFESKLVYPYLLCKFLCFLDLVLIMSNYEELEYYKWCFTSQLLFPFYNIGSALKNLIKLSAYAVLLVRILGCSVNGNDQSV